MTGHYLSDGDDGAHETVEDMCALVDRALKNPRIYTLARRIVQSIPAFDNRGEVHAIYDWVRRTVRFTMGVIGKQSLQTAEATLELHAGQCTDLSILLAALLMSIGYAVRFVAVATDPEAPDQFSHIYPEAKLDGQWVCIDAARENAQFDVPPAPERVYRREEFDILDEVGNMPHLGQNPTLDQVLAAIPNIESGAADIIYANQPRPVIVQANPSPGFGTIVLLGIGAYLLYTALKTR